jgi:hypothetical protein
VFSQNSNNQPGYTRKPSADIYTLLLIMALVALLVGIVYLHLEMQVYNYKSATGMATFRSEASVAMLHAPSGEGNVSSNLLCLHA